MKTGQKLASSLVMLVLLVNAPMTWGQEPSAMKSDPLGIRSFAEGLVGASTSSPVANVAIGAGLGGIAGGLIGSSMDGAPQNDLVGELISILNETKSVDTLIVTTETLMVMKADAKRVLPVLIRNAERLKLIKGAVREGTAPPGQKAVLEAIEFFAKRAHVVVKKKTKEKSEKGIGTVY